jgi:hypothetical protein
VELDTERTDKSRPHPHSVVALSSFLTWDLRCSGCAGVAAAAELKCKHGRAHATPRAGRHWHGRDRHAARGEVLAKRHRARTEASARHDCVGGPHLGRVRDATRKTTPPSTPTERRRGWRRVRLDRRRILHVKRRRERGRSAAKARAAMLVREKAMSRAFLRTGSRLVRSGCAFWSRCVYSGSKRGVAVFKRRVTSQPSIPLPRPARLGSTCSRSSNLDIPLVKIRSRIQLAMKILLSGLLLALAAAEEAASGEPASGEAPPSPPPGLEPAAVASIAVGAVAAVIIVAALAWMWYRQYSCVNASAVPVPSNTVSSNLSMSTNHLPMVALPVKDAPA